MASSASSTGRTSAQGRTTERRARSFAPGASLVRRDRDRVDLAAGPELCRVPRLTGKDPGVVEPERERRRLFRERDELPGFDFALDDICDPAVHMFDVGHQ